MSYNSPEYRLNIIVRFVSPALKHIVFPVLSHSGYLRRRAGDGPAVVTYHGVFPPGYKVRDRALDANLVFAESFRRQLELLRKSYRVISPANFLDWVEEKAALPPRPILLTCDDALQNTLTVMVPILQEAGLSCLFFATGAPLEPTPSPSMLWYEELYLMMRSNAEPIAINLPEAQIAMKMTPSGESLHWWQLVEGLSKFDCQTRRELLEQIRSQVKLPANWKDKYIRDPRLASRFLTLDLPGLRKLVAAGMTVGAHSLSHPVLARAPEEVAWQEISGSRSALERALGQNIWAFGYPFGNAATVTQREIRLAERAGFRCAFLNIGGGLGAKFDRYAIPRVHVTAGMKLAEFEAHIAGFYRSLRERFGAGAQPIGACV